MRPVLKRNILLETWRVGRVAMQRIANPWTSVRLRDAPPFATLAQLVERNLAKVEVIGSNPMCRSKLKKPDQKWSGFFAFEQA